MSTIESENIEKRPEDRGQSAPPVVEGASNPPEKKNSKFSTLDDDLSFLNSLPSIGKPEKKPAVIEKPGAVANSSSEIAPQPAAPVQAPQPPVATPPPAPKADQKEMVRPVPPSVEPAPVIAKTPAPVVKEIEKPKEDRGPSAPPVIEKAATPPEKKDAKSNTFDDDLSFLNSLPAIGKPEKKPAVIEKPQTVSSSSSKIAPQPAVPVQAPQPPVATPPPAPKADQKETVRPVPPAVKPAPVIEKTPAPVVKEIEKPKEDRGPSAPPVIEKAATPPEKKDAKSNTFDDDLSFLNSLPAIGKPEKKPAVIEAPRAVSSSSSKITPQPAVPVKAPQPPVATPPPAVKPAPVIAKTPAPVVKLKPQPQQVRLPPKAAPSSQKQVPKKTQSQIQREAKNRLEKEKAEAKKSKKQEAHQAAKNGKSAPNAKEQPPEKKSLFRRLLKF
ncbi:MAG: hypothetical protein WC334_08715 [Kiritimatiellales bacterium]